MQSATMVINNRRADLLSVLGSALGGALLTGLGLLLYYLGSGLVAAYPPLIWQGPSMTVVVGESRPVAEGLEIQPVNNVVFFRFSPKGFMARPYSTLVWRMIGIDPTQDVRLIWQIQSDSSKTQELSLQLEELQSGHVALRAQPGWEGYVVSLGLLVRGSFPQSLRVEQVELHPEVLGAGALIDQAWQEWTTAEYWSLRSVNYISGTPYRALFPPVVVTAIWIGLSATLYGFGLLAWPQRRWHFSPLIVLVLIGWGLLDLRWQLDLAQRSVTTVQRFFGKNAVDKNLAANDGDLFRFLQKIRSYLPVQPGRIFVINNNPAHRNVARDYMTLRTRYHLQPHNSFIDIHDGLQLGKARPGDYILILQSGPGTGIEAAGLHYDSGQVWLKWESGGLPVEAIDSEPLGHLLRVKIP